jgi:hypothetical protein
MLNIYPIGHDHVIDAQRPIRLGVSFTRAEWVVRRNDLNGNISSWFPIFRCQEESWARKCCGPGKVVG